MAERAGRRHTLGRKTPAGGTDPTKPLTIADVSARLGIKAHTWTAYVARGEAPPPDGRLGRTPWWYPATIDAWEKARPRA